MKFVDDDDDITYDHGLLSKWKHVTCAETPLHASTQNDKNCTEKKSLQIYACMCTDISGGTCSPVKVKSLQARLS